MKFGTFMDIISVHYNDITSLFKSRLHGKLDEDSFNDTFIKCAQKFGNEIISYETVVKYFWTAYTNTVKANICNDNRLETVSIDVDMHDCVDETTEEYTNIYNIVTHDISNEFGEEEMMMYVLYKFHDWSKQDLIDAGYDCDDFDSCIAEVHKFLKKRYTHHKKHSKQ